MQVKDEESRGRFIKFCNSYDSFALYASICFSSIFEFLDICFL